MICSNEDVDYKHLFPMLNDDKVYLDSASTTFTPQVVIDDICEYMNNHQGNYNRGVNDLVVKISNRVNDARKTVAEFINAKVSQVCFSSGSTQASDIIAHKIAIYDLKSDDEILLCRLDHSSTIDPWLEVKEKILSFGINVNIKDILIDTQGDYNEQDLLTKVNEKTKYVVLTHIHNVFGLEMGIKELVQDIRKINPNVNIVLDASQSVGHVEVDVEDLDVDYLYFSGHKMFATTGVGVLYARNIDVQKFENGTPNILGIISLGSAIKFINNIGIKNIETHIYELTRYLYDKLLEVDGIEFNKGIAFCKCALGYGIISFRHNKVSSEEINEILNYYKIYVRSSNFCQEGQDQYIRLSLHLYNNKKDIDKFIKVLKYVVEQS